ncbi:amidohydrolase family protein [Streptomyces roseirectus]|uniref:Amidohydrolase family protein n=1 Tax=Streptomyces roseirectus TaxID=2768066 RepID=A0A7H0IRF1_9ACTN|nr:amidohydrolase family protein [Streptomyces roseirectus]QNP75367.1 amidohydrolase family protein [Streptomyces roseirectus]
MHGELLALRAGHVFDGVRARRSGTVLVEDGVILDVDFTGARPPAHAEVTDFGPDAWLLPGLIDAHVHLCWDGSADAVAHVTSGDRAAVLATARDAAAATLRAGVTTVRDLGDRDYLTLALRDGVPAGERPEIVAAGPPITTPSGHCHFLGGVAQGAGALRAAVRERAERGCEVVKVMASGGRMTPGSDPARAQYRRADLRLVVDEAHRLGLSAAAHAHALGAVVDAVNAGFDSVEHFSCRTPQGSVVRRDLLDEVVRRGTFVSLTLAVRPGGALPPGVAAGHASLLDLMTEVVASGARVVAGTDSGIAPQKDHGVYPYALRQLTELGMSPLDALRAATTGAAEAVGRAGRKGVLRPGADADLLALDASPVDDIAAVTGIRAVYRAGRRVR